MTGPHGFFTLDPQHTGDVVFAATGTGLAPVLPMLAELSQRQEAGRREVYWGLRREEDLFVPEEVAAACAEAGAEPAHLPFATGGHLVGARGAHHGPPCSTPCPP